MHRDLRPGSARGIAEVEFVMVLPLLLFLVFGVTDVGRGLIASIELQQAVQEGALFASFDPSDPAAIEDRVRSSASGMVDLSDPAVVVSVECPDGDEKVAVRATYTLPLVTPLVAQVLGDPLALEARSVGSNFTDLACTPS